MSAAVPNHLINFGKKPIGVQSMKAIDVEYSRLLPINANSTSIYSPTGVNRVYFRFPCFQNSVIDNARSYITMKVTTGANKSASVGQRICDVGVGSLFDRIVIKSSTGVVLEDITNHHVLQKLFKLMSTDDVESRATVGDYSGANMTQTEKGLLCGRQSSGITYKFQFETGILSKHLAQFLPIGMMNNGSAIAFDLELYLSDPKLCMQMIGDNSQTTGDAAANPAVAAVNIEQTYTLSEVVYNMCLLKLDESLMSKFNQLAKSNGELIIPFTTYRSHQSALATLQSVVMTSDACSDLRRAFVTIVDSAPPAVSAKERRRSRCGCVM